MVQRLPDTQVFTLSHPAAEEVFLACDCLGWFPMRRDEQGNWTATLQLPPGHYSLRYYVRIGQTMVWCSHEDVEVPAGLDERREAGDMAERELAAADRPRAEPAGENQAPFDNA